MIQGGGFTAEMQPKPGKGPIKNEADKGLNNDRGTIAMARTGDPHSATAQFFINSVNNNFLNHKNKTQQGWGYAAFGRVIEGLDVVDAISAVQTTRRGMYRDVPVDPVMIKSVKRIK
jgi:peptidyl-prolyl cis-trans isomerase B (cyclophilin B)